MNEQKKQKLLEQYDDAAFALLMDEYAEEEGARLMAEFEAAQAAGQVPQMPAELDEQCRRMIRRDRAKKRGIRAARSFRKVAVKAAVAVLVFIGLITTVVMSVEALRIPVLNFIVEQYEKYAILSSEKTSPDYISHDTPHGVGVNPLESLLPENYQLGTFDNSVEGHLLVTYLGNEDEYVSYTVYPATNLSFYDIENAEAESVTVMGYNALFIEKNGYRLIWFNDTDNTAHSLTATHLSYNDFWALAECLSQ